MKNILFILFIGVSLVSKGQKQFTWDIKDSSIKTKNQIYSDIKLYIAKSWNSANTVIQNDDKEGGIIVLKALTKKEIKTFFDVYKYSFQYTITFQMKDYKHRIIIDQVRCSDARSADNSEIYKIQPQDNDDYKTNLGVPSSDKLLKMMNDLKMELYLMEIDYLNYMKESQKKKDNW